MPCIDIDIKYICTVVEYKLMAKFDSDSSPPASTFLSGSRELQATPDLLSGSPSPQLSEVQVQEHWKASSSVRCSSMEATFVVHNDFPRNLTPSLQTLKVEASVEGREAEGRLLKAL